MINNNSEQTFAEQRNPDPAVNMYESPYLFNGKELDEETSLYYYGARYMQPILSMWMSVDPLSDAKPNYNPYAYCSNNPITRIDPDGMLDDLYIKGDAAGEATRQLQQATSLTLTRDANTGKITATGAAKTKDDELIYNTITDASIQVQLNATTSPNPAYDYTVGAFLGNNINEIGTDLLTGIPKYDKKIPLSVTTYQEINVAESSKMDKYFETPGRAIAHEVTESYIGGKIAQKNRTSTQIGNSETYNKADSSAIKQPGGEYGLYEDNIPNSFKRGIYMTTAGKKPKLLHELRK